MALSRDRKDMQLYDIMDSYDQLFVDRMLMLYLDRVVLIHSLIFMQIRRKYMKT